MKSRTLGRTGLAVSEISLGCVELGMPYGAPGDATAAPPSDREVSRLLAEALRRGVTLFDTARSYGRSEELIGRELAGRRDEFVLVTKVEVPADTPSRRICGLVDDSVRTSLRLLGVQNVDVLLLHSPTTEVLAEGRAFDALEEQRGLGRTRWIGASTYGIDAASAALADGRCDCLELAYSLLDRRLEGVITDCRDAGVGVIARSVLLKGVLTQQAEGLPEELASLRAAVSELGALAAEAGMTLPQLAYRFVLGDTGIATALVGTARLPELIEVIGFAEQGILPRELAARARDVTVTPSDLLDPFRWPAA